MAYADPAAPASAPSPCLALAERRRLTADPSPVPVAPSSPQRDWTTLEVKEQIRAIELDWRIARDLLEKAVIGEHAINAHEGVGPGGDE